MKTGDLVFACIFGVIVLVAIPLWLPTCIEIAREYMREVRERWARL